MITLTDLYALLDREGIHLKYVDLPEGFLGLCVLSPVTRPVILLDKSLQQRPALEKCVLAEEIGHYKTGPRTSAKTFFKGATLGFDNEAVKVAQDERAALCWATSYLLPTAGVLAAIRSGVGNVADLAGHFGVTEQFARLRLRFLAEDLAQLGRLSVGLKRSRYRLARRAGAPIGGMGLRRLLALDEPFRV